MGAWAALALVWLLGDPPAADSRMPLLALAHAAACGSPEAARAALERLARAPRPLGVPDEAVAGGADAAVGAASLDVALDLLAAARRRPELAAAVAALVKGWEPCALREGERVYDLQRRGDRVIRRPPVSPLPLGGRGLRAFGWWPGAAEPEPAGDVCSDPALLDGLEASVRRVPGGPLPVADEEAPPPACLPPPPPVAPPRAAAAPAPVVKPPPPPPAAPRAAAPPRKAAPQPAALPPSALAIAVPIGVERRRIGLAGSVAHILSLQGPATVAASVSYAPWAYTFVRAALAYRYFDGERALGRRESLSWSWGAGYDDWHPGTFSLQINNWGPIPFWGPARPLQGAAIDVGYKIPLPAGLRELLASSVRVTVPLSGTPSLALSLAVIPWDHFSVWVGPRLSLGDGRRMTWSYGFGYSDWRPFTFGAAYVNYNANPLDELNFAKGAMVVSWSWAI